MPIYEFICRDCENRFDELIRSDNHAPTCSECSGEDVVRVYSPFAVHAGGGDKAAVAAGGAMGAGQCLPGPAGAGGGGCCGGGCGSC